MAIISKKRLAIQEHNKERFTEIKYPKVIIDRESYYKDEIKRLEKLINQLNIRLSHNEPLELFRDMLSFKCLRTLKDITIIQCSEHQKKMSCICLNRTKTLRDYLNIR
ncbi:hypothetical protein ES702_01455 [subsurface metagenome]